MLADSSHGSKSSYLPTSIKHHSATMEKPKPFSPETMPSISFQDIPSIDIVLSSRCTLRHILCTFFRHYMLIASYIVLGMSTILCWLLFGRIRELNISIMTTRLSWLWGCDMEIKYIGALVLKTEQSILVLEVAVCGQEEYVRGWL